MIAPGHREMKFARTRLAMLDALLAFLAERRFQEISVNEICEKAGVSYATFFNYFTKKDDLLLYFIQLWSVDVAQHTEAGDLRGLEAVEEVFYYTARQCRQAPGIMAEVVAYQALRQDESMPAGYKPLTLAEKMNRYPAIRDFSRLWDGGLLAIFPPMLASAAAAGEIPRSTDIQSLAVQLAVLFLGVPAALGPARAQHFESVYRQHLSLLWKGIQGGSNARPKPKQRKR
jgi:AcrR family transcriptional regulator